MPWDLLRRIFGPLPVVTSLDAVRPGRSMLVGTVKADGDLVRSPLKGLSCVAYYYRASYDAQTRGQKLERVVKQAEVYAPRFALEMEGGTLAVVPAKPGSFDPAEHRRLTGSGMPGLRVVEQIIRPGDRVRIRGVVRVRDGRPAVSPAEIVILGADEHGPRRPPRTAKRRRKDKGGR
ncbi:MAG: hypothetical protein QME96_16760 [Myxococcota bacterium]|nr:hypothetical protein [Myxococcota bacterium]